MATTKSCLVSGNLTTKPLKYRLCPSDEFSTGQWSVAISSVAYASNETSKLCCQISSNFVVAQKFSESLHVVTYEQPLTSCFIDTSKTARRIRQIHTSNKSLIFLVL